MMNVHNKSMHFNKSMHLFSLGVEQTTSAHMFSKIVGIDEKIFEEKLFISTI
jgi:hypothetical protein